MNTPIPYSFQEYLKCIKKCYASNVQNQLPDLKAFPKSIIIAFESQRLNEILQFGNNQTDPFLKSICKRIVGIHNIQTSRRLGKELNIKYTWKLISDSILELPKVATISSIGSQGFLSIPLFKYDKIVKNFEFIRFHLWSPELDHYIDEDKRTLFSIHSHSFNAQSWILLGELVNQDYKIVKRSKESNGSLFMNKL